MDRYIIIVNEKPNNILIYDYFNHKFIKKYKNIKNMSQLDFHKSGFIKLSSNTFLLFKYDTSYLFNIDTLFNIKLIKKMKNYDLPPLLDDFGSVYYKNEFIIT